MSESEKLAKRLDVGWERCEAAPPGSRERERLETFWIGLLRKYEEAVDQEEGRNKG